MLLASQQSAASRLQKPTIAAMETNQSRDKGESSFVFETKCHDAFAVEHGINFAQWSGWKVKTVHQADKR